MSWLGSCIFKRPLMQTSQYLTIFIGVWLSETISFRCVAGVFVYTWSDPHCHNRIWVVGGDVLAPAVPFFRWGRWRFTATHVALSRGDAEPIVRRLFAAVASVVERTQLVRTAPHCACAMQTNQPAPEGFFLSLYYTITAPSIILTNFRSYSDYTRSDKKVRELMAVKVLHSYLVAEYHCGRLQSTPLGKLCANTSA
jgi:hypothetical protein